MNHLAQVTVLKDIDPLDMDHSSGSNQFHSVDFSKTPGKEKFTSASAHDSKLTSFHLGYCTPEFNINSPEMRYFDRLTSDIDALCVAGDALEVKASLGYDYSESDSSFSTNNLNLILGLVGDVPCDNDVSLPRFSNEPVVNIRERVRDIPNYDTALVHSTYLKDKHMSASLPGVSHTRYPQQIPVNLSYQHDHRQQKRNFRAYDQPDNRNRHMKTVQQNQNQRSALPHASTHTGIKSTKDFPVSVKVSKEVFESNGISKSEEETPAGKAAYKEFSNQFKKLEEASASVETVSSFANSWLDTIPVCSVWRVYLDCAEYAKRQNKSAMARHWYGKLCLDHCDNCQGWQDWAKMEEELGHTGLALRVIGCGLWFHPSNEALSSKGLKLSEKNRSLEVCRMSILSTAQHQRSQDAWKIVFEGTLLEARAGNARIARELYCLLLKDIHWYGPIYYEAFRLEEKLGCYKEAINIIRIGLQPLPKYGPLWFGLLRMLERSDLETEYRSWLAATSLALQPADIFVAANKLLPKLKCLRAEIPNAVANISKELVWKVYFEVSMAEQRAAGLLTNLLTSGFAPKAKTIFSRLLMDILLKPARQALFHAAKHCPGNLLWKIWIVGARLEIHTGSLHKSRALLHKALQMVPLKSKAQVYVESSRLEEYSGRITMARQILQYASECAQGDWKVALEAAYLECRSGHISTAIEVAENGIKRHPGTGRLWALLVQLHHRIPRKIQLLQAKPTLVSDSLDQVVQRALREVPKSGEVWCEAARTHLNPMLLDRFDLGLAQSQLAFAIQFTPQYGDSFIEYLRLELLIQVMLPPILTNLGLSCSSFIKIFLSKDSEGDSAYCNSQHTFLSEGACHNVGFDKSALWNSNAINGTVKGTSFEEIVRQQLRNIMNLQLNFIFKDKDIMREIVISSLENRCLSADPNYGALWFHCRNSPIDSPVQIIDRALDILAHELFTHQAHYLRAVLWYVVRCVKEYDSPKPLSCSVDSALSQIHHNSKSQNANLVRLSYNSLECVGANAVGELFNQAVGVSNSFCSDDSRSSTCQEHRPLTPRGNRKQLKFGRLKADDISLLEIENSNSGMNGKSYCCIDDPIRYLPKGAGSRASATTEDVVLLRTPLWEQIREFVWELVDMFIANSNINGSNGNWEITEDDECDEIANLTLQSMDSISKLYREAGELRECSSGCGDFITGLISFNHKHWGANNNENDLQELLYGCDEIVP